MVKILITLFFYLNMLSVHAQDDKNSFLKKVIADRSSFQIGVEYAELQQNKFRNIGKNNFTFLIGQQFKSENFSTYGWRYMIINAELSNEHIQNPKQVCCIEGNRIDLTGDVHAQRLSFDYYPLILGLGYINKWERYVLQVTPVLYSALGYNSWGFVNTKFNESYRLNAFTVGGGLRLQSVLFDIIFVENPLVDIFFYTIKNRSVRGIIGDTEIARPEYFGIFGWATIGIKIKY